jgi:tetratricopeptide (TPR) repeat protein
MSSIKLILLSLILCLSACTSILSSGASSGASKAFVEGNYQEAIRKVDRAMAKYEIEYTTDVKSKLLMVKADSLGKLGEYAKAQALYLHIVEKYYGTEAAVLAASLIVEENNNSIVTNYQFITKNNMSINLAKEACQNGAKQEAAEYFGVDITSNSIFEQNVENTQVNQDKLSIEQLNVNSIMTSDSKVTLSISKLKENVNLKAGSIVIHCQIKTTKLVKL